MSFYFPLCIGPPLTQKLSGGGDTPPDLPLSPPPPIGFTGPDVTETEHSVSVVISVHIICLRKIGHSTFLSK